MAVTKSEPDGKHPASHYLVVPDPQQVSGWALRYKDAQGNVDRGLCGNCWAALFSPGGFRGNPYQGPQKAKAQSKLRAIYKAQGWDLPTANSSADDGEPDPALAVFEADLDGPTGPAVFAGADTEMVTRRGLIFEAGDYPDKFFSLSPEEMAEAAAAFEPVPIDLEHRQTVLDGHLGQLAAVELSDDGSTLIGEARLPKWLDDQLGEGKRKVSAMWDRATKRLVGLSLVVSPRVSDAALMAAFAGTAHKTASGQAALQRIHDIATDNGAVCRRDSAATMASRSEAGAMQQVHDMVVGQGAECEPAYAGSPRQASRSTELFSQPPPSQPPPRGKKGKRMNIKEWILGKAQEEGVEVTEDDLTAAFAASGEPGPDLETVNKAIEQAVKDRDAKIAALEAANQAAAAEFSRMAGERRRSEAVTFADSKVATHRVPPACAAHLANLAERISATDTTATFGEGEQPTMALLAAFVDSLPDMTAFTRPQVAGQAGAVFANAQKTPGVTGQPDEPDEDRIKELLSKSTLGRVIVKERERAQNGK